MFGVGFLLADRIARGGGRPADDPERARAGALHVLAEAERGGSTCLPIDALLPELAELLGAAARENVSEASIDQLVGRGDVVRAGRWIYRRQTAELEAELAHRVSKLLRSAPSERLRETERGPAPVL